MPDAKQTNWGGYYDATKNLENFQESFDPVFNIIKNLEESKDLSSVKEILSSIYLEDRNKLNSPVLDAFLENFLNFPKNVFYNGNRAACDFILQRGFTDYEEPVGQRPRASLRDEALKCIMESSHDPVEMIGFMQKLNESYSNPPETLNNYLINSVEKQHINKVTFLLTTWADPAVKNSSAFSIACENGYLKIVRLFIEHDRTLANHELSLILACSCGHLEIVKLLAENGANVHTREETPLISACSGNYLEIVKFLVERGANINTRNSMPLSVACNRGNKEIVEYLLIQGCNVNPDTYPSPLYYACMRDRFDIAKNLITHGANINIQNGRLLSDLYFRRKIKALEFLLDNGGNITGEAGESMIIDAVQDNRIEYLEFLLRRGVQFPENIGLSVTRPEVRKVLEKYGKIFLD